MNPTPLPTTTDRVIDAMYRYLAATNAGPAIHHKSIIAKMVRDHGEAAVVMVLDWLCDSEHSRAAYFRRTGRSPTAVARKFDDLLKLAEKEAAAESESAPETKAENEAEPALDLANLKYIRDAMVTLVCGVGFGQTARARLELVALLDLLSFQLGDDATASDAMRVYALDSDYLRLNRR